MKRIASVAACLLAAGAACADDGPVKGVVEWMPNVPLAQKYECDKIDYWSAIAFSPSTGKYGASCYWTSQDNAVRVARENCNAKDARAVVLCCNGWCSLALGEPSPGGERGWGVGWGADRETAERFAMEGGRDRARGARVVYSINSREMPFAGVIAYSTKTGGWGYSSGYGRSDATRAVQFSGDPSAEVVVGKCKCCWMALALGDDKGSYGCGWAGNRLDAERNALEECGKRTRNAKIAVSFPTNGAAQ